MRKVNCARHQTIFIAECPRFKSIDFERWNRLEMILDCVIPQSASFTQYVKILLFHDMLKMLEIENEEMIKLDEHRFSLRSLQWLSDPCKGSFCFVKVRRLDLLVHLCSLHCSASGGSACSLGHKHRHTKKKRKDSRTSAASGNCRSPTWRQLHLRNEKIKERRGDVRLCVGWRQDMNVKRLQDVKSKVIWRIIEINHQR